MAFCFECGAYPCERIRQAEAYDSFLPHRNMRADAQRAQEMGLATYLAELQERAALLERLLAGYNDGRRKGLFCAAAYLLEVEVLRQTVEALEREAGADWPIRQRAELAAGALAAQAARLGVDLKLHKKPRER